MDINKILNNFLTESTKRVKDIVVGASQALIENSNRNNTELTKALKQINLDDTRTVQALMAVQREMATTNKLCAKLIEEVSKPCNITLKLK